MPERFTETETVSSLVVDLGSVKFSSNPYAITASAENVSEDFFYDHYSVCISGVNAGIITMGPSSSSQPHLLGLGDIVRKFDLNLDLKLLTAATPELPKVKLAANLPDLHLDVTRDKIVRLLDILKSLSPPAPVTEELGTTTQSSKKPAADSRPASSAIAAVAVPDSRKSVRQPDLVKSWTSSSARAISTMIPVENQKKEPEQKAADPVVTKVASVEFQLQRLVVSLGLESHEEGKGVQPLVDIKLIGAGMTFSNSSVDMKVGLNLRGFEIVDKMFPADSADRRQKFIVCSRGEEDGSSGSSLVAVEYLGVPKDSPSYNRVDHRINVQFGFLDFNVNRLSIALLLQVLTSLSATSSPAPPPPSEIQLPTPAIASKAQEELVIQKEELLAEAKQEEIEHPPETFDFSLAKIDITLRGISLNLNKDGVTFLSAELAGTTAHIDARGDTTLFVDGSVESLTVTESNVSDPDLAKIVSIGGEKMLLFTYETFSKANSHAAIAYPGYDMSVRVRLGSIRAVFVNRLVKELGSYFGAFAQMREVTAAAASYYYTQSKEAVKAASAAVKLHLDIVVVNPYVVVPSSAESLEEQLILDLGRISIKNKFERIDPHRVIIDDLKVSVESFNLRTEKMGAITPIIGKTDIIVGLRRAVERNERHWVPDLELAVGISAVSVSLCESQVAQIMKTLKLNVAAHPLRQDDIEMKKIAELLSGSSFNADSWRDAQSKMQANALQPTSQAAEGDPFIYLRMKLKLAQVAFALSEGSGLGSDGRHTSVVQLSMNDMSLLLDMRSDSALQMKFTLREIVAEDTRLRTNNQFRRLLSKAARSEQVDDVEQIAVEYGTTPATQRTDIKVLLNYPRISIIPDSLAYIYKFSMSVTNATLKELADFQSLSRDANQTEKSLDQPKKSEEVKEKQDVASPVVSAMVATVVIKSPEIAVVEDSFSPSTSAFIMHLGDSTVRFIQTGDGQQKIDLHLENFDLSKCNLSADPGRAAEDVTLLLQPFTIGFNMSSSPSDETDFSSPKRSRMAVELGLLKTILSYRDMRLALTIWKSFTPLLAELQSRPAEVASAEENASAPVQPDQSLSVVEPANAEAASSIATEDIGDEPSLNMIVSLQGLSFSMLDDKVDPSFSTPVLRFWIDAIQTTIRMWPSQEMILTTSFDTIELDAYNNELASHEPVIEPWRLSMEYHQKHEFKSIHVEADEMLDVNVTKSLLDATLNGLELFRDLTSEKDMSSSSAPMSSGGSRSKKEAEKRLSFNPYVIRNSLSRPIRYWISGRSEAEFGHTLQVGQEEPLLIRETRENVAEQPARYEIDVRILDDHNKYHLQRRIPISKVQSVVRKVHADFADLNLVAAIEYQNGSKIVTLRSDHTIMNCTEYDLEITVDSVRNSVKEFNLPPLSPGSSTAVPIDCADFSSLKVRPVGNHTFFCIARNEKSGIVTCSADPRNEESAPSWMCTFKSKTVENPDGNHDTAITFHPSIIFENALPTGVSVQLVSADSVVWQKDFVAKIAEAEFYQASKPIRLSDLAISVQTPGFSWSKRVPFAKKIGGDPIRLSMKDPLGRPLKLSADVKKNDSGTIIVSVFSPYILVNQSGLRLAYKKDSGEKEVAAGQNFEDASVRELEDDQNQWYSDDEQSKLSLNFAASVDYGYAKNRLMYGEKTLSLRVENSGWSKSFPLGVQNQGVILIEDAKVSGRLYEFAVVVSSAPGRLWRTKVARIYPHVIVVNKTSRTLFWKQEAREKASSPVPPSQHVAPDHQVPLHWPSVLHEKKVAVSLDGDRTAARTCHLSYVVHQYPNVLP
jgi:vacuolar protein sorting-associated protein 13A/C